MTTTINGLPGTTQVTNTSLYGGAAQVATLDVEGDGQIDALRVGFQTKDGWFDSGVMSVVGNQEAVQTLRQLGLGEVVQEIGADWPADIRAKLGAFSSKLSNFSGLNMQDTQQQWANFLSDLAGGGIPFDVNELVQFVLRESYMETTKDLQFYAQKVRYFNELKKQIREHLTEMRGQLSAISQAGEGATFDPPLKELDFTMAMDPETGLPLDPSVSNRSLTTKEDIENYVDALEEKLSSVGDDAQLANVDLQNWLQKQQQTIQMMSNISKMLHDTALAVIRKIG